MGGQCRQARGVIALAFFAAKTAAHAPHFHLHQMIGHPQNFSYFMLNFGGVLRRYMNQYLALFIGHGHGGLAF